MDFDGDPLTLAPFNRDVAAPAECPVRRKRDISAAYLVSNATFCEGHSIKKMMALSTLTRIVGLSMYTHIMALRRHGSIRAKFYRFRDRGWFHDQYARQELRFVVDDPATPLRTYPMFRCIRRSPNTEAIGATMRSCYFYCRPFLAASRNR